MHCIYICLCKIQIPEQKFCILYSSSLVPAVLELYKIHIMIRTLVYCFHKIVRYTQWIQRPGIMSTLSLILLTFFSFVRQWKAWKCSLIVLTSLSTHYHTHCTGTPEMRIPPYYTHTVVIPMVSTLEVLHCIPLRLDPHIWGVVLLLRAGLTRCNIDP